MKKHTSGGNNSAAKGFYERIFYIMLFALLNQVQRPYKQLLHSPLTFNFKCPQLSKPYNTFFL